jgi:regulator of sirC expression with transglutaminase-like and TPR domain
MWNTAMLYAHFGRFAEARQLLDSFVARHPDHPRVDMVREMIEELGGQ